MSNRCGTLKTLGGGRHGAISRGGPFGPTTPRRPLRRGSKAQARWWGFLEVTSGWSHHGKKTRIPKWLRRKAVSSPAETRALQESVRVYRPPPPPAAPPPKRSILGGLLRSISVITGRTGQRGR